MKSESQCLPILGDHQTATSQHSSRGFPPGLESPSAPARLHICSGSRGDSDVVSRGSSSVWSPPSYTVPTDSAASVPLSSDLCHPPWHGMLLFACQARCCGLGGAPGRKPAAVWGCPLCSSLLLPIAHCWNACVLHFVQVCSYLQQRKLLVTPLWPVLNP